MLKKNVQQGTDRGKMEQVKQRPKHKSKSSMCGTKREEPKDLIAWACRLKRAILCVSIQSFRKYLRKRRRKTEMCIVRRKWNLSTRQRCRMDMLNLLPAGVFYFSRARKKVKCKWHSRCVL